MSRTKNVEITQNLTPKISYLEYGKLVQQQNLTDPPSPPTSCLDKPYNVPYPPHSRIHTSTNLNGYIELNTNELFFYFIFPHILKIVNKFVKQEKHPLISFTRNRNKTNPFTSFFHSSHFIFTSLYPK